MCAVIACGALAVALCSGCNDAGDGPRPFVQPTPAQQAAIRNNQISSIMNNPNIPADQKQRIIALTVYGPAQQTSPAGSAPKPATSGN